MAHGLPDWYRGVDIAYQALSELITRPTYGGAIGSSGSKTVYANNTVTLINISGQGMIYGIYVRVSHTATQRDSGVRLELDSNLLFDESEQVRRHKLRLLRANPVRPYVREPYQP